MYLTIKVLVFVCVVICSADAGDFRSGEACLVQYLREKGKLNASIQSLQQPIDLCKSAITPLGVRNAEITAKYQFEAYAPNQVDCLISEFKDREAADYLLKIRVFLLNEYLNKTEKDAEFEAVRNEFKNELKQMAASCGADSEKVIESFKEHLGIKNEIDYQIEYCLANYFVDQKILLLDNVPMNPHQVDATTLDCDKIVEEERSKDEKVTKYTVKEAGSNISESQMDCIVKSYWNVKAFEYGVALKFVTNLDVHSPEREAEIDRLTTQLVQFTLGTMNCIYNA